MEFGAARIPAITVILGVQGQISQQELLLFQANANSADYVPAAAHAPAESLAQLSPYSSRGLAARLLCSLKSLGIYSPDNFSLLI